MLPDLLAIVGVGHGEVDSDEFIAAVAQHFDSLKDDAQAVVGAVISDDTVDPLAVVDSVRLVLGADQRLLNDSASPWSHVESVVREAEQPRLIHVGRVQCFPAKHRTKSFPLSR